MGVAVLFLDENVNSVIHGYIPARRANHYMPSLKVSFIVKVDCFEVSRCSSMYKITDYPFLIRFILPTIIDEVCYIKYPRVRNKDDPWVTVTRLNPRGRVQGSSELEDPLQPSTSGNCSAAEDLAGVGLVVDLTDFGEEAVVHVEDEPVIGEFHQDPDSDSSGDDDSETD
uniref:DUF4216 domain-containing protein n=1 Tax=Brassica oleracea var. oleracea TaxID=109376 RepID=A0A0D3CK31_BRAOL